MNKQGEERTYVMQNMDANDRVRFNQCRPVLVDRKKPFEPVQTKQQFYRRFYAGEFGNHSPMWQSLAEWKAARYPGRVAIRTLVRGGRCDYLIPPDEVADRHQSFLGDGYKPDQLNISAQCPEEDKLLQGEVARVPGGLYLFGSTSVLPMRPALRTAGFHVHSFKAQAWLRACLCPNSWEWMQYLLDAYPDHVIEFTTLRYPWGTIPHHNTVIWEVRNY